MQFWDIAASEANGVLAGYTTAQLMTTILSLLCNNVELHNYIVPSERWVELIWTIFR